MKKTLLKQAIVFTIIALGLSSCSKDDESVEMNYIVSCSADLLKFVSPVVTYTDGNGMEKTITLTDADWNKDNELSMGNGNSSTTITGVDSYTWTKRVVFDSFGVSGKMTVKYVPLTNTEDTTGKKYLFKHNISISANAQSDNVQSQYVDISLDLAGTQVDGTMVSTYINKLVQTPDTKKCVVDGDGGIVVK